MTWIEINQSNMSKENLLNLQKRIFNFIFNTIDDFPEQEDKEGYLKALEDYQEFQYDEFSLARGLPIRFKNVNNVNFKLHCERVLEKLRNVYRFTLIDDEQLSDEGSGNGHTYDNQRRAIVLVGNQIKTIGKNYLQGRDLLDNANLQDVNFKGVLWSMAQQCLTDHICDAFGEEISEAWLFSTQPEAPYGKGNVVQIALSMIYFGQTGINDFKFDIPKEMESDDHPKPIEWYDASKAMEAFKEEMSYMQGLFESKVLSDEAVRLLPFETLDGFNKVINKISGARQSVKNLGLFIDNASASIDCFKAEAKATTNFI